MQSEVLTTDGFTPWIQLGQFDNRIEVRSEDWTGTSATIEYSLDKNDDSYSVLETLDANGAYDVAGPGYVRLTATGVNDSIELVIASKPQRV